MRNKLQDCLQLEKETIGRVTSGTETWTAFLKVMARNYKYAYSDQLMTVNGKHLMLLIFSL